MLVATTLLAVACVAWAVLARGPFTVGLALVALGIAAVAWRDALQVASNVRRNFPVLGTLKALIEDNRQIWQQAVIENDREGRPYDLVRRLVVTKRAAGEGMHSPFGTGYDYGQPGHEWLLHSMHPLEVDPARLRVRIGGRACRHPYDASLLNVAGMSYGSISPEATKALAIGARLGGFASNTGEGGLAAAHLQGGDVVFQFGTGYFGCRTDDGRFDEGAFRRCVAHDVVRMVEIKLSQGAKPGFGAILPAHKNTPEIAAIRGIEPGSEVHSPPAHRAFSTPEELCAFVARVRELADGRPVGIKLCLGQPAEWRALLDAMVRHGPPDFVTVDGGEGGTGAAALESLHWVGMPLDEALVEVVDGLVRAGLRDEVRVLAAGKVVSAFDVVRLLALGADGVCCARAMMLALGCTQALLCDTNRCPTGVTTMDPRLRRGLVVEDKAERVARFHRHTLEGVAKLLGAAGLREPRDVRRHHVCRRTTGGIRTYEELWPSP